MLGQCAGSPVIPALGTQRILRARWLGWLAHSSELSDHGSWGRYHASRIWKTVEGDASLSLQPPYTHAPTTHANMHTQCVHMHTQIRNKAKKPLLLPFSFTVKLESSEQLSSMCLLKYLPRSNLGHTLLVTCGNLLGPTRIYSRFWSSVTHPNRI